MDIWIVMQIGIEIGNKCLIFSRTTAECSVENLRLLKYNSHSKLFI